MGSTPFGALLRAFRVRAGLTQGDLAERSGMGATTISELERGVRRAPQFGSAELLAEALGLETDDRELFFATVHSERRAPGPRPALAAAVPPSPGELFGRDDDLARIAEGFAEGRRLVTLTGPGGVGKTRLALDYALSVAGSSRAVAWVGVESLSDPDEVLPAVLRALGRVERSGVSPLQRLTEVLADREVLLVIDNLEHLLDVARDLGKLLDALPSLAILVTSREALRIAPETVVVVGPLRVTGDALPEASNPAIALFLDRAGLATTASAVDLAAAARICDLLDGLPLAIELAAAQSPIISPPTIADLLAQTGLDGLAHGPRDSGRRFRTMEEAIRWSTGLLEPEQRDLLRAVSIFRGGFPIESVSGIAARMGRPGLAGGLPRLLAANLVHEKRGGVGEVRLAMLEPIRLAASAELAASEFERAARDAHAAVMREGAVEASARHMGSETAAGLAFFQAERANMLAALDHLLATGNSAAGLSLANALGFWWEHTGAVREGVGWLHRAIAADDGTAPARDRWLIRWLAALLSLEGGDYVTQRRLAEETLAIAQEVGDLEGEAMAELALAMWLQTAGDDLDGSLTRLDRAIDLARDAVRRDGAAWLPLAYACSLRATFRYYGTGEADRPIADYERALAVMRGQGAESVQGMPLVGLAAALQASGRRDEALSAVRDALDISVRFASPLVQLNAAMRLASLLSEEEDRDSAFAAARLLGALESLLARQGFRADEMMTGENRQTIARLLPILGDDLDAAIAEGREMADTASRDPDLLMLARGG